MKKTVEQESLELEQSFLKLKLQLLRLENRAHGEKLAENRKLIKEIKNQLKDNGNNEVSLFPPF